MSSGSAPGSAAPEARGREDGDPNPLQVLQLELDKLRGSKKMTYRALADKAHYSPAILNRAVKGDKLPTWGVVEAFVTACDGDVERFRGRWNTAAQSPRGDEAIQSAPELRGMRRLLAWARRSRRRTVALGVVLLLLLGGLVAGSAALGAVLNTPSAPVAQPTVPVPAGQCAPDLVRRGPAEECVGLTDAGFTFSPELGLAPILQAIKRENDAVYDSGEPSVSLAYIAAFPRTPLTNSGAIYLDSVKHELQGALLAQLRANEGVSLGDTPKIRLLVANVGDGSALWRDVIPALLAQTTSPNRLVALIGMGNSVRPTLEMIDALSGRIPMFPSRLTANVLSAQGRNSVDGLFRIAPSNAAETVVAAQFAKERRSNVVVIEDRNPDDNYTADLRDGFNQAFTAADGAASLAEPEIFNSALDGKANAFLQMMPSICAKNVATIYFAGRGNDLQAFLQALATRSCQSTRMQVLTGDDGVSVTAALRADLVAKRQDLSDALARGNISLAYTALSHPNAWTAPGAAFLPAAVAPFTGNCATCLPTLFPGAPTDDDAAVMAYDSALVPITCLRSATRDQQQPSSPYTYTAGLTTQLCYRVNQAAPVQGASGPIAFDPNGNVRGKSLPVVELRPDGATTMVKLAVAP